VWLAQADSFFLHFFFIVFLPKAGSFFNAALNMGRMRKEQPARGAVEYSLLASSIE
jgi:hypothetical protein